MTTVFRLRCTTTKGPKSIQSTFQSTRCVFRFTNGQHVGLFAQKPARLEASSQYSANQTTGLSFEAKRSASVSAYSLCISGCDRGADRKRQVLHSGGVPGAGSEAGAPPRREPESSRSAGAAFFPHRGAAIAQSGPTSSASCRPEKEKNSKCSRWCFANLKQFCLN